MHSPIHGFLLQVDKTDGLLFEKPIALQEYSTKGHDLVAIAFRPFFPALGTLAEQDQLALKEEFCTEAHLLGQNMLNTAGMVEDKHLDFWVTAYAVHQGCEAA